MSSNAGNPADNESVLDQQAFEDELEELSSEDFPNYFNERNGRLYHASNASPYPLPCDTPEQERLTVQHRALAGVIGANYVGPVQSVLAPREGQQKVAVDLGCGTGRWVIEMVEEFPHVLFQGLDIVPIAPRDVINNVNFEIRDIAERTGWANSSVDLVHARSISMAVRDYSVIVQESARILKPGGMFLSGEWGRYPSFWPSVSPVPVPGITQFYAVLHDALAQRGIPAVTPTVAGRLRTSGAFTDISEPQIFYLPIGPWHDNDELRRLGRAFRVVMKRYLDSVQEMLLQSGIDPVTLDQIYFHCLSELYSVRGLATEFHVVHARKT